MKQLGITDSAFINLEHPNTPQHIGSIGVYDQSTAPGGTVRFKQVIAHFERQLKKLPLFRTRLITPAGGFARQYWVVDEDFDVEFHVRHLALPSPGDWRQLCILIARLHSRPIDMSRPLWESYIIEGLDNIPHLPKGCFVIYNKLHHSLIDGGGGTDFMTAIHDLEPIAHDHTNDAPEIFSGDSGISKAMMVGEMTKNYFENAVGGSKGAVSAISEAVKSGVKLVKGELPPPPMSGPETRFNQPVGPHRVMEGAILSLNDIKMIKNKTKTKLNDVVLAVVSGAMRKYLESKNELPEESLVATVPMNMRTRRGDTGQNNQVGSMFTKLNSHIADPIRRLLAVHESTEEAKLFSENSPMADTLKLAGALSPRMTKRLVNFYVDNELTRKLPMKVNTVVSNVPGAPIDLYASGARLVQYHGLGVLTPGVGLFHLAFSYLDKLSITILADRAMMPDPDFYRECLETSMKELTDAVNDATEDEIDRLIGEVKGAIPPLVNKFTEAKNKIKPKAMDKRITKKSSSSKASAKPKAVEGTVLKAKASPKKAAPKKATVRRRASKKATASSVKPEK